MILIALQTYFLKVKTATSSHLLKEFKVDEAVLQDMLSFWIKKGKLKKIIRPLSKPFAEREVTSKGCKTPCNACQLGCSSKEQFPTGEVYEWIG